MSNYSSDVIPTSVPKRPAIVTGMPGTGVRKTMDRFVRQYPMYAHVAVDQYLPQVVADVARRLGVIDYEGPLDIFDAFALPEAVLRDRWPLALNAAMAAAPETGLLVVSLHAAWYHVDSTGLVPAARAEALRPHEPSIVISLIDDIFDVVARLSRRGHIFEPSADPRRPKARYVRRLLKTLAWREAEFRASQSLAQELGVPHALLAVKHPMETLRRVLTLPRERWVYLSHPIAEAVTDPSLIELVHSMWTSLEEAEVVCFAPATIDEQRFVSSSTSVSPSLRPRWPLRDPSTLLWDGLLEAERPFVEQPFSTPSNAWDVGSEESWRLVSAEIDEQIRWRDKQLVAQSGRLLALRPFASPGGTIAGGVEGEARLFEQLALYQSAERPEATIVVHHPEEDERRRKVNAIASTLRAAASAGVISGADEVTDSVVARCEHLLRSEVWVNASAPERATLVQELLECLESEVGSSIDVNSQAKTGVLRASARLQLQRAQLRDLGASITRALLGNGPWEADPYAKSALMRAKLIDVPSSDIPAVVEHALNTWGIPRSDGTHFPNHTYEILSNALEAGEARPRRTDPQ